jgi:hypothetical protein
MIKPGNHSSGKGFAQQIRSGLICVLMLAACSYRAEIERTDPPSLITQETAFPASPIPTVLPPPQYTSEPYPGPFQFQPEETTMPPYPMATGSHEVQPTPTPLASPPFADTRVLSSEELLCEQGSEFSTCFDEYLNVRFEPATEWGVVTATLRRGDTGLLYRYDFGQTYDDGGKSHPQAGGISADFSEGRGGTLTDFQGFIDPERDPCDYFLRESLCREIQPGVYSYLYFPNWRDTCDQGPIGLSLPLAIIAIDLPGRLQIKGLAFVYLFGSQTLNEEYAALESWLLGELSEKGFDRCVEGDELIEEYSRLADELRSNVINDEIDLETKDNLWKFRHLANSIEIQD